MKILRSIDNGLAVLEGWLICTFLGCMVVFTFLQVCLRGLYTHGGLQWANALMGHLDWSEPLVRLLVLWLTFLGASLLTREGSHIKIDVLSALLPRAWLPLREFILAVASVIILAVMVKVSLSYLSMERAFGTSLFLDLPGWIGQLILPLGFGSMFMRFLIRAVDRALDFSGAAKR